MGRFVKGDVVVLNFPFSDFSATKRRPAVVVSNLDGDDVILCQITSRAKIDKYAVKLETDNFISGRLTTESIARPNKIFTAYEDMILYVACKLNIEKINEITQSIVDLLTE